MVGGSSAKFQCQNFNAKVLISPEPDVVMQYSFGRSDQRVEADGFDPNFHHTSFAAATANALMRHMNWILQTIKRLPESWVMHMGPEMTSFVMLKRVSRYILGKCLK
jgi:hypothetical protein